MRERKNVMGREGSRIWKELGKRKGYDKKNYAKFLEKICKEGKVVSVRAWAEEVPLSTNMQIMQIATLLSNIYDF